jgi:short-subunit dehydrogenase
VPDYRTALVTGASSGLGEAFARLLAAAGCDLILVARKADQLHDLAGQLAGQHGITVEILPADLTLPAQLHQAQERLADAGRPVDLLVNSAGTLGRIGRFADQPADAEIHKIDLNASAAVALTRAVLPGMLERGRGAIINVSSVMGFLPTPHAATYSATKAFLVSFSESLHGETRLRGVHVTALCPGSVRSKLHDADPDRPQARTAARFGVLDPEAVARAGLDAVAAGQPVVVPGRRWAAVARLSRLLPRALVRKAFYRLWGRR